MEIANNGSSPLLSGNTCMIKEMTQERGKEMDNLKGCRSIAISHTMANRTLVMAIMIMGLSNMNNLDIGRVSSIRSHISQMETSIIMNLIHNRKALIESTSMMKDTVPMVMDEYIKATDMGLMTLRDTGRNEDPLTTPWKRGRSVSTISLQARHRRDWWAKGLTVP